MNESVSPNPVAANIEAQVAALTDSETGFGRRIVADFAPDGNSLAAPMQNEAIDEVAQTTTQAEAGPAGHITPEQLDLLITQMRQEVVQDTFKKGHNLIKYVEADALARLSKTTEIANQAFDYASSLATQAFGEAAGHQADRDYGDAVEVIRQARNSFENVANEIHNSIRLAIEQAEVASRTAEEEAVDFVDNAPAGESATSQEEQADRLYVWSIGLANQVEARTNKLAHELMKASAKQLSNEARILVEGSLQWTLHQLTGGIKTKADDEVFKVRGQLDPQICFANAVETVTEKAKAVYHQLARSALDDQRRLSANKVTPADPETPAEPADSFEAQHQAYQETVQQIYDQCQTRLLEKLTAAKEAVTTARAKLESVRSAAHSGAEQAALAGQVSEAVWGAYVEPFATLENVENTYMQTLADLGGASRAHLAFKKSGQLDQRSQVALEEAVKSYPAVVNRLPAAG